MNTYRDNLIEERNHWTTKLELALEDENYRLCAFLRDKIKRVDVKLTKLLYNDRN
jgi:protein-arginine kinase activator protein McsA